MKHIEIPARELRDGDLLRVTFGSGYAYVLIADAIEVDGQILLTVYDRLERDSEPTLARDAGQVVTIRADRGLAPVA